MRYSFILCTILFSSGGSGACEPWKQGAPHAPFPSAGERGYAGFLICGGGSLILACHMAGRRLPDCLSQHANEHRLFPQGTWTQALTPRMFSAARAMGIAAANRPPCPFAPLPASAGLQKRAALCARPHPVIRSSPLFDSPNPRVNPGKRGLHLSVE